MAKISTFIDLACNQSQHAHRKGAVPAPFVSPQPSPAALALPGSPLGSSSEAAPPPGVFPGPSKRLACSGAGMPRSSEQSWPGVSTGKQRWPDLQVAFWVRSCARPFKNRSSILICSLFLHGFHKALVISMYRVHLSSSPRPSHCQTDSPKRQHGPSLPEMLLWELPGAGLGARVGPHTGPEPAQGAKCQPGAECLGSVPRCCLEATVPHLGILVRPLPPFPLPASAAEPGASSAGSGVRIRAAAAPGVTVTPRDKRAGRRAALAPGQAQRGLMAGHPPQILLPVP